MNMCVFTILEFPRRSFPFRTEDGSMASQTRRTSTPKLLWEPQISYSVPSHNLLSCVCVSYAGILAPQMATISFRLTPESEGRQQTTSSAPREQSSLCPKLQWTTEGTGCLWWISMRSMTDTPSWSAQKRAREYSWQTSTKETQDSDFLLVHCIFEHVQVYGSGDWTHMFTRRMASTERLRCHCHRKDIFVFLSHNAKKRDLSYWCKMG
jgi:hypothetical protein